MFFHFPLRYYLQAEKKDNNALKDFIKARTVLAHSERA